MTKKVYKQKCFSHNNEFKLGNLLTLLNLVIFKQV